MEAACFGFILSESSEEDSTFLPTTADGLVGGGTLALVSVSLSDSEELSLLDSFFLVGVALIGGLTTGVSSSELESRIKSIRRG